MLSCRSLHFFTRSCTRSLQCQRRSIFHLPNFSSFSPFSNSDDPGTQTYHERKILPYTQRQLYEVVSDVASYPRFVPFCQQARILKRSDGDPSTELRRPTLMDAELTVGFLSFKESYVSKVTCRPYESVQAEASSSTPLFKTLTTTWRFQPASAASPHPSANVSPPDKMQAHRRMAEDRDPERGPTLVELDLAYAFANPVHVAVSSAFFGQVSKQMVKAFEERCLEVYGAGKM